MPHTLYDMAGVSKLRPTAEGRGHVSNGRDILGTPVARGTAYL